ncbi:MAG: ADP-ribosylation factor-like protein [Promethearchaeota archaeon]
MEEKKKLFLFGLDAAGKSSLIKYIKDKEIVEDPSPTRDFDVLDMVIEQINFVLWDAPGQHLFRDKWEKGVIGTDILIFIIDTSVKERFEEAKEELHRILNNSNVKGLPLIVLFHKIDILVTTAYIKDAFKILGLAEIKDREVYWLKTSIINNKGIDEFKLMLYHLLIILESRKELDVIQNQFNI